VRIERAADVVIAVLTGEVDISNVTRVSDQLKAGLDNSTRLSIIDLTDTTYLDSVGIRLLFSLAESINARRQHLRLVVPPDSLLRGILELVSMGRVIPIDPDRVTALNA
jgi:anti-anti-sigma factor